MTLLFISAIKIGDYAFEKCESLETVNMETGVKEIGERVFYDCTNLKDIQLPESIIKIGEGAFNYTSWIEDQKQSNDFVIVNGILIEIGKYKCTEGHLIIPSNVTNIGNSAFEYCEDIISITLPDGLLSIEGGAFSDCVNLRNVTLPDGLISIGDHAFSGCENLVDISIPSSVKNIGGNALRRTPWIEAKKKQEDFVIVNNILLEKGKINLVDGQLTIPNGITEIADSAFYYDSEISSVTIPGSVKRIGESAFEGCENLEKVIIEDGVTQIGDLAFAYGKVREKDVSIPDSVTEMGEGVFEEDDW